MRATFGDAGFTLLELLVALVVFGFVLAGIVGGVQFGLRAGDMQARQIADDADLGAAERTLRQLMAAMDPGTLTEAPDLQAGAATLGFVTNAGLANALGEGGAIQVGLGVDASHRLLLRWTPYRHAIALSPRPAAATAVLLEGVERVQFAYWGHGEAGAGSWLSAWTEKGLPPLVRIHLTFAPGSRRTWPDIIAATYRQARTS